MGILTAYQMDAVKRMKNGCILCGSVGSGKSRTALAYYFQKYGGIITDELYFPMDDLSTPDLYIITTARKRDLFEWDKELSYFLLTADPDKKIYKSNVIIDSWNNIKKYSQVKNAFFIFDEDRVTGKGVWVSSFLKISRNNQWIILSATPGDDWCDYIPVFIANGFYRNRTEFNNEHVVFKSFVKFPVIDRYLSVKKLIRLRDSILIDMNYRSKAEAHHYDLWLDYDIDAYRKIVRTRIDPWELKPIENPNDYCFCLRKLVNLDESREVKLLEIFEDHPKLIIFYNFNCELELLKSINYGEGVEIAEWNGHKHQPIPTGEKWIYLVNYLSGAEGWNCITTDTIVFYSQTYSYKTIIQASGRIDRFNSPYKELYYYHFRSKSSIDKAIYYTLSKKKNFNERKFFESVYNNG